MKKGGREIHLMIAIPTLDYIHWKFSESLIKLSRHLFEIGVDHDICFEGGTLVYISRDKLVRRAVFDGYTHVLWLDADLVFEPDIFEKLIDVMHDEKAHLVTGIYQSRHGKHGSILYSKLVPGLKIDEYPDDIFEIAGCGFGCVLTFVPMLSEVSLKYDTCFMPTPELGEDLAFCKRAKDIGFKLVADPHVFAGHIGQSIIWPETSESI